MEGSHREGSTAQIEAVSQAARNFDRAFTAGVWILVSCLCMCAAVGVDLYLNNVKIDIHASSQMCPVSEIDPGYIGMPLKKLSEQVYSPFLPGFW